MTENQSVYHTRYNCSYLQLSISAVPASQLEELRNESGSKYGACGTCDPPPIHELNQVYITDNGGSYHISMACSGLKRTVSSVLLEDVIGKGVCHRCGS